MGGVCGECGVCGGIDQGRNMSLEGGVWWVCGWGGGPDWWLLGVVDCGRFWWLLGMWKQTEWWLLGVVGGVGGGRCNGDGVCGWWLLGVSYGEVWG